MSNYFSMETAPKDRRILIFSGENYYCSHWGKNACTDEEAWIIVNNYDGEGSQVLCKHPIGWSEIPKYTGLVQKEQLND